MRIRQVKELTQQEIQDMNLMTDVFMSVVFQNKDCNKIVTGTLRCLFVIYQ